MLMREKILVSRKKNAVWTLFFQYASLFIAFIKGLLLVPLYLKFIDYELYGYWLTLSGILTWMFILDPGFADVVRQRAARAFGDNSHKQLGSICASGMFLNAILFFLIIAIGFLGASLLPKLLHIDNQGYAQKITYAFQVSMLGNGLLVLGFAFSAISTALQRGKACGIITVISNLVSLLVLVICLFNGLGVDALAYGILCFGIMQALGHGAYALLSLMQTQVSLQLNWTTCWDVCKASSVNFYGKSAKSLSEGIDRFFIVRVLGPDAVVGFELTRRAPSFGRMIVGRLGNALASPISHLQGEGDMDKVRHYGQLALQVLFWLVALLAAGFIALNEMFMQLWIGPGHYLGFWLNAMIVGWICLLVVFNLMNILIFSMGEVARSSNTYLMTSLILIPLMYLGTFKFGLSGLVAAALVVFGSFTTFRQWPQYVKVFQLGVLERRAVLREMFLAVVAAGLGAFALSFISPAVSWPNFIANGVLLVLLIAAFAFSVSGMVRQNAAHLYHKLKRQLVGRCKV